MTRGASDDLEASVAVDLGLILTLGLHAPLTRNVLAENIRARIAAMSDADIAGLIEDARIVELRHETGGRIFTEGGETSPSGAGPASEAGIFRSSRVSA